MILHHPLASSPLFVVVEQLNEAQWHACRPYGQWRSTGVGSYIHAVADALWMARDEGLGVVSIDLDYNRLVLAWPERVS